MNWNDNVWVKLSPEGEKTHLQKTKELSSEALGYDRETGFVSFPLWRLMDIFGPGLQGKEPPFEDARIFLTRPRLDPATRETYF